MIQIKRFTQIESDKIGIDDGAIIEMTGWLEHNKHEIKVIDIKFNSVVDSNDILIESYLIIYEKNKDRKLAEFVAEYNKKSI